MSSAYCLSLLYESLLHYLRDVFDEDIQRGRILVFKLSISSSQGFYKKIVSSELEVDVDLKN